MNDLSVVYGLFLKGMAIGALLSAFPFLVGFVANSIHKIISKV